MSAIPAVDRPPPAGVERRLDQRVMLHRIGWRDYEALLAMRGESSGTRVAYLEGELELMTPSLDHEVRARTLGKLVAVYAEALGIELTACGSWAVRKEGKSRGVEADESFVLGPIGDPPPEVPDLAVDVVWTGGGIDKLEVYRGLGVPEVWFWRDGALSIHLLDGDAYRESPQSRLLPDLDPVLIERLMAYPSQTQAVRGLREALRGRSAP